jgi:hypothetical protein
MVRGAVENIQPIPTLTEEQANEVAADLAHKIRSLPSEHQVSDLLSPESEQLAQLMREAREQGLNASKVINITRETLENILDDNS